MIEWDVCWLIELYYIDDCYFLPFSLCEWLSYHRHMFHIETASWHVYFRRAWAAMLAPRWSFAALQLPSTSVKHDQLLCLDRGALLFSGMACVELCEELLCVVSLRLCLCFAVTVQFDTTVAGGSCSVEYTFCSWVSFCIPRLTFVLRCVQHVYLWSSVNAESFLGISDTET